MHVQPKSILIRGSAICCLYIITHVQSTKLNIPYIWMSWVTNVYIYSDIAVSVTLVSCRVILSVQLIMAKLFLCLLSLVVVGVCVYAEPGQRCATTLCAAVMCSYGEEPFRPPGQCCLRCRPAKPKEGMFNLLCWLIRKYLRNEMYSLCHYTCTCMNSVGLVKVCWVRRTPNVL